MDIYAEMDSVSFDFVNGIGLQPCTKKKHTHAIPEVKGAGEISVKTYGVYHLKVEIADRRGNPISIIRPFLAIRREEDDSPILLGRPALKYLAVVIDNEDDIWEFKKRVKVEALRTNRFRLKLKPRSKI